MRLANTLTCRHPETHKRHNFAPGEEIPDWAEAMLVGRADVKWIDNPPGEKKAPAKKATAKKADDAEG